jgi:hypothetical protein
MNGPAARSFRDAWSCGVRSDNAERSPLDHEPLPDLRGDRLLALILQLSREGDALAQQELFADVQQVARSRGYGDVIDSWQEKFPVLRG